MTDSLHRPLYRLGTPKAFGSVDWSYGRTDGRTHADLYSPNSDISPFVTHTRAYESEVWS